ncbi:conserved hypothetical protein [Rippkaea orientalis PCC 8801]|uniref:NIL domain-containing protein n=1 Tax=Rippkaea orientalis (strain PCC 8801 / RF-1) TaxID=41431 RepID=B7K5L7_RIPO1|nr:NIL domain-containing protein [Rippkaea orientalis]ACK66750.1 conserved hypothetical protein [Rippkaea orientalis PCC 8801]
MTSHNLTEKDRPIQRRIRIEIPSEYHQDPIISQLATFYHLKINILGAILGQTGTQNGWFDIELQGESEQIENALLSLRENNIVIWDDSTQEYDGW